MCIIFAYNIMCIQAQKADRSGTTFVFNRCVRAVYSHLNLVQSVFSISFIEYLVCVFCRIGLGKRAVDLYNLLKIHTINLINL